MVVVVVVVVCVCVCVGGGCLNQFYFANPERAWQAMPNVLSVCVVKINGLVFTRLRPVL